MLGAVNTRQLRLSAGGVEHEQQQNHQEGKKNAFKDKLKRETATLAEG